MSYTNKTQPTKVTPKSFLEKNFKGKTRLHKEVLELVDLYTKVTGSECVMWNRIFGFGRYHYYDSKGGEHIHLTTGFSVSSTGFTLYNMMGWEAFKKDIEKLGKYKLSGKSCLAIKSVEDIDLKVLKLAIKKSVTDMKKKYKTEK